MFHFRTYLGGFMKLAMFGHGRIELTERDLSNLEKCVRHVVKKLDIDEFIYQDNRANTKAYYKAIDNVLQEFQNIKYTYITTDNDFKVELKTSRPTIEKSRCKFKPEMFFDEIKHIDIQSCFPKSSIQLCYHVIDEVDICIFLFQHKRIAKRAGVTAHAYDYALKKKKIVFNIAYKL